MHFVLRHLIELCSTLLLLGPVCSVRLQSALLESFRAQAELFRPRCNQMGALHRSKWSLRDTLLKCWEKIMSTQLEWKQSILHWNSTPSCIFVFPPTFITVTLLSLPLTIKEKIFFLLVLSSLMFLVQKSPLPKHEMFTIETVNTVNKKESS